VVASIAVVAPHPDDETLGAGASLLRHVSRGDEIHWIIATRIPSGTDFGGVDAGARQREIDTIAQTYGFASVQQLPNPPATLDAMPLSELVAQMASAIAAVAPSTLYVPWPGDAHSDHRLSYEAASAATKSFRSSSVTRILAYEALSETNFAINPLVPPFRPNCYHDVSAWFPRKLDILSSWQSEIREHPWPRSLEAATALATLRGSECGASRAEAFAIVREFS